MTDLRFVAPRMDQSITGVRLSFTEMSPLDAALECRLQKLPL